MPPLGDFLVLYAISKLLVLVKEMWNIITQRLLFVVGCSQVIKSDTLYVLVMRIQSCFEFDNKIHK